MQPEQPIARVKSNHMFLEGKDTPGFQRAMPTIYFGKALGLNQLWMMMMNAGYISSK